MALNKPDKETLDRWHRNEGKTEPPRRGPGAPEGNQNRLRHGIFADRCLTPEEKVMFDAIIDRLNQDFEFNKSSDFLQVELVGVYSVKLVRAQIEGNTDAAEKLDRMIRCHMKDLKTTKIAREGEEQKGPQTSPAEWAAALLEKDGFEKVSFVRPPMLRPRKPPAARNAERIADNTMEGFSDDPDTRRLAADDFSRNCG